MKKENIIPIIISIIVSIPPDIISIIQIYKIFDITKYTWSIALIVILVIAVIFVIIYVIIRFLIFLFYENQLNRLYAQQKEENKLYIKNINDEEIALLEFKGKFKFDLTLELRKAIKEFFENFNRPEDISYRTIRKFAVYIDYKKNKDNHEIDIKPYQFASYLIPTVIFSSIGGLFIVAFYIIKQTYSHLYKYKLNTAQILPYYRLFINNKVYLIFLIISYVIIVAYILFIYFRICGFIELYKLKKSFGNYYNRTFEKSPTSERFEKFKKWVWPIRAIFFSFIILNVGIFAYYYYTMSSLNIRNINRLYLRNINKSTSINEKYKLNLPIFAPKQPVNIVFAKNKLAVKLYLGDNGFLKDTKKAIYLWGKAAEQGCAYSELNLGYIYAKNPSHILPKKNYIKASLYIEKAFYNKKSNQSIRALARKVWNQYELWRYYKN